MKNQPIFCLLSVLPFVMGLGATLPWLSCPVCEAPLEAGEATGLVAVGLWDLEELAGDPPRPSRRWPTSSGEQP